MAQIPLVRKLAEKEGFEPSHRLTQPNPLAGDPLEPLEYFSKHSVYFLFGGEGGIRTHGAVKPVSYTHLRAHET